MCQAIYTIDGERLGCLAEIESAGFDIEPGVDYDGSVTEDECCCSVDIEAIVERSGLSYEVDRDEGHICLTQQIPGR